MFIVRLYIYKYVYIYFEFLYICTTYHKHHFAFCDMKLTVDRFVCVIPRGEIFSLDRYNFREAYSTFITLYPTSIRTVTKQIYSVGFRQRRCYTPCQEVYISDCVLLHLLPALLFLISFLISSADLFIYFCFLSLQSRFYLFHFKLFVFLNSFLYIFFP